MMDDPSFSESILRRDMETALSGEDLMKIVENNAEVLIYNELYQFKAIEEVMGPHKAAIILYEWKPNFGHWVTVFESIPGKRIEFFDPYAYKPDDEKSFIPTHMWKMGYMSQLLYDASKRGWEIEYNDYQFQTRQFSDVATCGRWVTLRLLLRHMPLQKFKQIFSNKPPLPSDLLVTALTKAVLGK